MELHHSQAITKESVHEMQWAGQEMDDLIKQVSDQNRIRATVQLVRDELEDERKLKSIQPHNARAGRLVIINGQDIRLLGNPILHLRGYREVVQMLGSSMYKKDVESFGFYSRISANDLIYKRLIQIKRKN